MSILNNLYSKISGRPEGWRDNVSRQIDKAEVPTESPISIIIYTDEYGNPFPFEQNTAMRKKIFVLTEMLKGLIITAAKRECRREKVPLMNKILADIEKAQNKDKIMHLLDDIKTVVDDLASCGCTCGKCSDD